MKLKSILIWSGQQETVQCLFLMYFQYYKSFLSRYNLSMTLFKYTWLSLNLSLSNKVDEIIFNFRKAQTKKMRRRSILLKTFVWKIFQSARDKIYKSVHLCTQTHCHCHKLIALANEQRPKLNRENEEKTRAVKGWGVKRKQET